MSIQAPFLFSMVIVEEKMQHHKPATATVVNLGVSFLHLRVTENIEKPIDEVIP